MNNQREQWLKCFENNNQNENNPPYVNIIETYIFPCFLQRNTENIRLKETSVSTCRLCWRCPYWHVDSVATVQVGYAATAHVGYVAVVYIGMSTMW